MRPRKSGKPSALEEEQEDYAPDDNDLESFLKEVHGVSLLEADPVNDAKAADDPTKLPSIGWLKEHFKTKSAIIRYLTLERHFPIKDVARHTGFKYQHVRNVTLQQLKRGPNETFHLAEGQRSPSIKSDD